ncbi:MAG: hypothetical protein EZS28_000169 [Streblomastix strix]|uniref:Uncharacterized protein n=1 Tax=Streblomastix strix TaxID=222440 RepID=A0A5J4XAT1_9EUKA|nr:MAG: hypothetical protein EZS28_000169 [Streblomastix strix]
MGNILFKKTAEISCGKAQEKLKIVFVNDDNLGQRMYLEGISDRTTMDFVAKFVMNQLKAKAMDISFVSEYSKAMKLYTNRKKVTGDGVKSSVEAVSGFLTTGVTCSVDSCVAADCVRIRIDKRSKFVDIPYRSEDTVLDLKKKILVSSQIPTENQLMKFEDKVLTNKLKMTQIGIEQYDEKVRLAVQNQDTFGEVCSQACKEAQIDSDGVTLLYNSSSIEQNTLMGELDIDLENENQFTSKSPQIYIHVNINDQKKINLEFKTIETIETVKQKIQSVESISPDQQIMNEEKRIQVRVKGKDTIKRLMIEIQGREGIFANEQRLSFGGIQLDELKTLEDYNIQTGSTVELQIESTQITNNQQKQEQQSKDNIQIFVKLISGKTITFNVSLNDSIEDVKQMIQRNEKMPINEYRLSIGGRQLEDGHKLQEYDIHQFSTIDLQLRLLGGQPPKLLMNLEQSNEMTQLNWKNGGPRWRAAASGLSVEGRCNNESCIANGKLVIYIAGYCDFDMLKSEAFCPMCKQSIIPVTPGFSQCLWRIMYKKKSGKVTKLPWLKTASEYKTFRQEESGGVEYDRLVINARELAPAKKTSPKEEQPEQQQQKPSDEDIVVHIVADCGLCMKSMVATDENVVVLKCGHFFHALCAQVWIDRKLPCPHCDQPMIENKA